MKTLLVGFTLICLSSCNWSFKMTNADQIFESTITIIPVEDSKK